MPAVKVCIWTSGLREEEGRVMVWGVKVGKREVYLSDIVIQGCWLG